MRKILAFSLCLIMLLGLTAAVSADTLEGMMYNRYAVNDRTLNCYGMPLPAGSTVSVSCSGTEVTDVSLSTLRDAQVPITYFVIADASSSLSQNQKKQQNDALLTISKKLRDIDTMVLCLMGDQLKIYKKLTDQESRDQAINGNWILAYSTDLYGSVYEVVTMAQDTSAYPGVSCVVLLTDGLDDKNSQKVENVQTLLKNGNTPIHVLGLIDMFPDTYAKNKMSTLRTLADATPGSTSCAPGMENTAAADAAAKIVDTMVGSCVLGLDTDQLERIGGAASVSFSCTAGDNTYEGTMIVPESVLPVRIVPTEPETTAPETEPVYTEPAPTMPVQTPQAQMLARLKQPLILAAIGVAALVIAVILVIFAVRRNVKHTEREYLEADEMPEENNRFVPDMVDFSAQEEIQPKKKVRREAPAEEKKTEKLIMDTEQAAPAAQEEAFQFNFLEAADTCTVNLVDAESGAPAAAAEITVKSYKTFGRTEKADVVLNAEDTALRGVHFALYWDGTYLFVQDLGKGILVNGEPQETGKWVHLPGGANLTAGANTYRIYLT